MADSKNCANGGLDEPCESKAKKKRTTNPGVRVQGGRIYDSESGTTCHQCRQKTIEFKAKCSECTLFWCPRCLLNRYGEAVDEVTALMAWPCPRCRGDCNCSNCRKKRGQEATGILANVCKAAGISSVSDLLNKNPDAKRAALPPAEKKPRVHEDWKRGATAKPAASSLSKLMPDEELGERIAPFPDGDVLCIHKASKRMRGVSWPTELGPSVKVPSDCSTGDLTEVLEFLEVFGAHVGIQIGDMASFAAELVTPVGSAHSFAEEGWSPVGKVHQALLDLVRQDWGLKGTVGSPGWQKIMGHYLKQERREVLEKLEALNQHPHGESNDPGTENSCIETMLEEGFKDPLTQMPDGGYWCLPPGVRLRMLRALCHDSLSTTVIREQMNLALEECTAAHKELRQGQAAARKEEHKAWQEERNRQIALLVVGGSGAAMTLEEQKALMNQAKPKTCAVRETADIADAVHPVLRSQPLGRDRDGQLFWSLQSAATLTGKEGTLLVAKPWKAVDADEWSAHFDIQAVLKSLDARGRAEGPLIDEICKLFSVDTGLATGKTVKKRAAKENDGGAAKNMDRSANKTKKRAPVRGRYTKS